MLFTAFGNFWLQRIAEAFLVLGLLPNGIEEINLCVASLERKGRSGDLLGTITFAFERKKLLKLDKRFIFWTIMNIEWKHLSPNWTFENMFGPQIWTNQQKLEVQTVLSNNLPSPSLKAIRFSQFVFPFEFRWRLRATIKFYCPSWRSLAMAILLTHGDKNHLQSRMCCDSAVDWFRMSHYCARNH